MGAKFGKYLARKRARDKLTHFENSHAVEGLCHYIFSVERMVCLFWDEGASVGIDRFSITLSNRESCITVGLS